MIGDYDRPKVRLPGGGGAPEIATFCEEVYVITSHTTRGLVAEVDFITSLGFGRDGEARERFGLLTKGPTLVITDLCVLRPDPEHHELEVTSIHTGVTRERIADNTGWPIRFARVEETPLPTPEELKTLRDLHARTATAHRGET